MNKKQQIFKKKLKSIGKKFDMQLSPFYISPTIQKIAFGIKTSSLFDDIELERNNSEQIETLIKCRLQDGFYEIKELCNEALEKLK